ncbi:MAG: alpha-1,4-glucan--maltose-1-phosphate maltosyltransferase [Deltaproteobacteria bacterium]|nr:alpha-1,4-glucan--maltose-1-phosphate maltosyltransferase [Deltaproteobacteria bacterium]
MSVEQHIIISGVEPVIDCGRYPVKRIAGESCTIRACVFRDGPDVIRTAVHWRAPGAKPPAEIPMRAENPGLDLWLAEVQTAENGRYRFSIAAWTDAYATWADELRRKVGGERTDLASEYAEGAALVETALRRAEGNEKALLAKVLAGLRGGAPVPEAALALAGGGEVCGLMARLQERGDLVVSDEYEIVADRPRARTGAWYEMFVRSQGTKPGSSGTFRDAEARLADIRDMGFDVVYLAPIHPIGRTGRKGRNNTLNPQPGDPGSPWAIGSEHGGHDAVEPALGTVADFERFVAAARKLGLEVALDFAVQCSPDHPWVRAHPEWFYRRPDGTLKYAENPPKKYEDIHPLNFDCEARWELWQEIRRVLEVWIRRGVTIFRVDNPHTKPVRFWRWLIEEVQAQHPGVLFLAEAFTRPPMMKELGKAGFTQSYTYFTWRNAKAEIIEYLTELTQSGMEEYFRPNFFVNTPDILHEYLQHGGRPAFKIRLCLAATLSPSYGIYSGFELCENVPLKPGSEEYLDSEKYEIKVRDWDAPGNIKDYVRRINAIRRENPSLAEFTNLRFLPSDSDQILSYAKLSADCSNVILVVLNLDPHGAHECTVRVPPEVLGLQSGARFEVHDLVTGARYDWGERNYVRLDPAVEPAHILRVETQR